MQRKNLFFGHASDIDYEALYKFFEETLGGYHDVFLPHKNGRDINNLEQIKKSDLFIAEVSKASIGLGIEIGIAVENHVPIVCIYQKGRKPSLALKHVCRDFIDYKDFEDLKLRLRAYI